MQCWAGRLLCGRVLTLFVVVRPTNALENKVTVEAVDTEHAETLSKEAAIERPTVELLQRKKAGQRSPVRSAAALAVWVSSGHSLRQTASVFYPSVVAALSVANGPPWVC